MKHVCVNNLGPSVVTGKQIVTKTTYAFSKCILMFKNTIRNHLETFKIPEIYSFG